MKALVRIVSTLALAISSLQAQSIKYSITDLGLLSERTANSAAWQVSDNGGVAVTMPAQDPFVHATKWTPLLGAEDLGAAIAAGSSVAKSINYSGDIAGWAVNTNGAEQAAVWHSQKGMTFLPIPGTSSHARGINDSGQVVGDYMSAGKQRAFIWDPNAGMLDLGLLPQATECFATAINGYQDVVGYCSNTADVFPNKAFMWSRQTGMVLALPKFGGGSVAFGINDLRQIAGYVQDKTGTSAYTSDLNSRRTQYFALAATAKSTKYGVAFGTNNSGQTVGQSNARAILYDQGRIYDLNSLIAAGTGWVLVTANHVNLSGQIVGVGNLNGRSHAFLLTPRR